MKRSVRFVAVVGLLVAALGLGLWPSSGGAQEQPSVVGAPLPEFIIAKDPGESALQVEVWTDKSFYMVGEQVTVKFELNQKGYVYLLDIAPQADGKRKVTLIFPSREAPLNYLAKGEAMYKSSSNDGMGFVQAIATPIPIPIVKSLDATVLGDDPQAVKQEILRKIQARGISEGEWGASWANYPLSAFAPFSPTNFGELVVYVLDGGKAKCPVTKDTREDAKLYNAHVYVDSSTKKFTDPPKSNEGPLADPPQSPFSRLSVEVGDRRVLVTVPLEYQYSMVPKTVQPNDKLRPGGLITVPPVTDPAQAPVVACFELQSTPEGVAQFTFKPPTPKMNEEVTFDASRSKAVGHVWDFGDGSPIATGGVEKAVVKHTYRLSGFYTVKLITIYSSDKKGKCSPTGNPTTSCELSRTINVPRGGPITDFELPGVSLKGREGAAPPTRAEREIELTARGISEIAFNFHYSFKSFPFTETMVVDWGWLDADSDITVQITFLNEKGEVVGLPQRKRFCPLQTYKEASEEGCTFRLPIGGQQSGSGTLNFFDDELYRIGVNKALLDGKIHKVKFLVEVGLTIRRNTLAQTANADIEVEYFDLQIVVHD